MYREEVSKYITKNYHGVHLKLLSEMDDLVVNDELLVAIVDDQDTDGSSAVAIGLLDLGGKLTLLDDLETWLDFTGVGHGDQETIVTDVNETVLLESRGEHGVQDNGWRWVGDNAGFLTELLGEQVNTEVSVLASLGGGSDANDLGWSLLEDDKVTNADVVAWDGEVSLDSWGGSWWSSWLRRNNLGLGDIDIALLWLRESIGLARLGVVRPWVESGIQLGTEVLQVVVVVIRLAHFFFLFLLDDDDATRLGFLLDVYVELFDVSWSGVFWRGNVELWSANESTNEEVLVGGRLAGRRVGVVFELDFWVGV